MGAPRRRVAMYARWGVPWFWLVEPDCTVEAFRLEGSVWQLVGTWADSDIARIEPFGAVELEIAALWART
jgi:Uma2 family endonuclease